MQHIDHDMDDLFRKAAADYPLKTGEDDWDKFAEKMLATPAAPVVIERERIIYREIIFAIVLACIMLGIIKYYDNDNYQKKFHLQYITPVEGLNKPGNHKKQINTKNRSVAPDREIILPGTKIVEEKKVLNHERSDVNTKQYSALPVITTKGKNKYYKKQLFHSENNRSIYKTQEIQHASPVLNHPESVLKGALVKDFKFELAYSVRALVLSPAPIKIAAYHSDNKKGFYVGLVGGPEFSKVGSQAKTKIGYHAGILAGYKLNSKWSIESGILIGENNYYSKGSYFSMSKVASSMPVGMEIMAIDGRSKHIEVPVVAKYNFLHRRYMDLFFTGGLLSNWYLQERNYYQTMLNGVKDDQMGLYKQNQLTLASQLRISIGYEHPIGRSGSIRIEPYKNFPLKKMGMGSMPVFSSGFNVGLVHLFR